MLNMYCPIISGELMFTHGVSPKIRVLEKMFLAIRYVEAEAANRRISGFIVCSLFLSL